VITQIITVITQAMGSGARCAAVGVGHEHTRNGSPGYLRFRTTRSRIDRVSVVIADGAIHTHELS
jgi:hypothetical protein